MLVLVLWCAVVCCAVGFAAALPFACGGAGSASAGVLQEGGRVAARGWSRVAALSMLAGAGCTACRGRSRAERKVKIVSGCLNENNRVYAERRIFIGPDNSGPTPNPPHTTRRPPVNTNFLSRPAFRFPLSTFHSFAESVHMPAPAVCRLLHTDAT